MEPAGLFIGNMDDGHAQVKMVEIKAHLDTTYFAWTGEITPDAALYMRIQSPVVYIEFDCESGGPASGPVEAAADPANATKSGVASGGGGGGAPGGGSARCSSERRPRRRWWRWWRNRVVQPHPLRGPHAERQRLRLRPPEGPPRDAPH